MKRNALLFAALISSAFIMQSCKKSSTDDTTTTTAVILQAYVNGTLWTPLVQSATLTYNSTKKTKTLVIIGTTATDEITWSITQPAATLDSTFAIQTYTNSTDTLNIKPAYFLLNANNVYVTTGIIKAGALSMTTFDAVNKVMTGTFAFNVSKVNYDSSGNLLSVSSNAITAGEFNAMPFTFKKL